jgi:hypothetical protein
MKFYRISSTASKDTANPPGLGGLPTLHLRRHRHRNTSTLHTAPYQGVGEGGGLVGWGKSLGTRVLSVLERAQWVCREDPS